MCSSDLNNRAATSPLDFDLDLAVRQDSENPVYYVQYAHARICSLIARLAGEEGAAVPAAGAVDAALLAAPEERALVKALAQYPEELHLAARDFDPSRINRYLTALAGISQHQAQGINLQYFLPAAAAAQPAHHKNGLLEKKTILPAILAGLVTSALAAWFSNGLDTGILRKLFGLFLLYIGLRELFHKDKQQESPGPH